MAILGVQLTFRCQESPQDIWNCPNSKYELYTFIYKESLSSFIDPTETTKHQEVIK